MPLSPLVGRERELAAVVGLLARPDVRLLTLSGIGGVGKTRLALAAAERAAGEFGDGAAVVLLAAVREPELVASSVVSALGLGVDPGRPAFEELVEWLRDREVLIVLDNLEQLRGAGSRLSELLGLAPRVKLLVTSRVLLRVAGEYEFAVEPLVHDDAVALFAARARAANADFELSGAMAADIGAVCERLDRVPLALELAATRLRLLTPRQLLARLDQRLPYLTGGPTDAPERHQTLRATLDWSSELLPPAAQALLARLSVFHGGFTVQAAQAVCMSEAASGAEPLDALGELMDHSLLRRAEDAQDPGHAARLWMLETVREYAGERLATAGAADAFSRRHANYFLELAQEANVGLAGSDQRTWLARLGQEQHNLHAALAWACDGHDPELAVSLTAALGQHYYRLHGDRRENAHLIERAIAADPQPSSALALALASLALLEHNWDVEAARDHADRAFAIAAEIHDPRLLAWCSMIRAGTVFLSGELELAERLFQETIELARAAGDQATAGYAVGNLANIALGRADYELASRLLADAGPTLIAAVDAASQLTFACLQASASLHMGRGTQALACLQASIPLAQTTHAAGLTQWVRACGVVLARAGSAERAARLLGQEEILRQRHTLSLDPTDRLDVDQAIEILNNRLYPEVLASAWRHGREMSLEDAIAEVCSELHERHTQDARASPQHSGPTV
jgi:predicted ATPase